MDRPTDQPSHELVTVAAAKPFPFTAPHGRLGLLNIDWQRDFLEPGGFGDCLGNNISLLQAALGPTAALLKVARAAGMPVFHTLEAHKPDLSNLPPSKKRRCSAIGEVLDQSRGRVLIEGEPGNAIVGAVAPIPGEIIINKPGKGAFWNTNFEDELRRLGVTHLLVTGVTTEVCVQTTIREANDRGYECLLVTDATESYFPEFKAATLQMIVAQGGIAGWTASTAEVIPAIEAAGVGSGLLAGNVGLGPLAGNLPAMAAGGFRTTLLAVSGTLQCGFELRTNLDHPHMAAVLVGAAVVRGVKAYLDVKEAGCREYRAPPELARVNPANVVTGARSDANLYAVYLVHEAVMTSALIGEPRYLAISPDAVRVDLTASATSPAVRRLLCAAAAALPGAPADADGPTEASILTVLSTYHAPSFVPLPPMPTQPAPGEYVLTSFPEGLAAFAGAPVAGINQPGAADKALRRAEGSVLDADACATARVALATGPPVPAACKEPWRPRLAALYEPAQLRALAMAAGFKSGEFGPELAALTGG